MAEFTQTPPDLPGCLALACLSTAAGGRAVVEVRAGWREPVNIYTIVVLPPGSRKSAVFRAMTEPVLAAERQLIDKTRPQITEAEIARRIAARAAERATQAAASATGDHQAHAVAEASAAALAAEAVEVPVLPRLLADDITPEAAASLLAGQGGRLAVLSAEGGIFATLAGRYSASGPNLEVFLKGHAGDMLRVDRKGRPAEHVTSPALTLGLAIQPEVLTDIARMPGFRGRGLLARLLYALPENTIGHRRIGAPPVPEPVAETYAESLRAMVISLAEWTDPAVAWPRFRPGLRAVSPPGVRTGSAIGAVSGLAPTGRWRAPQGTVRQGSRRRGRHLSGRAVPRAPRPCRPGSSVAVSGAGGPRIAHAAVRELAGSRAWPPR